MVLTYEITARVNLDPTRPSEHFRELVGDSLANANVKAVLVSPPPPSVTLRPQDNGCHYCAEIREKHKGFGPSHNGSRSCRSGSIASGGNRSHCTCDTCF